MKHLPLLAAPYEVYHRGYDLIARPERRCWLYPVVEHVSLYGARTAADYIRLIIVLHLALTVAEDHELPSILITLSNLLPCFTNGVDDRIIKSKCLMRRWEGDDAPGFIYVG